MDKPIRVAQVMGQMNGGGVEAVIMNYFRYIDRKRIQFDFIVCSDSTRIPEAEIRELGGNVILVPPYKSLFPYIGKLMEVFQDGSYDIVHVNMTALSVFPLFAAWVARVPVRINHSHSTFNMAEGIRTLAKSALRPFAGVFATDYMACGRWAGEWLFGRRMMGTGVVREIPNAIDIEAFRYDGRAREEARASLGVRDAFVVGHVGRFVPQKNHSFLLEILRELKTIEPAAVLLLVGEGRLLDSTRKRAAELGLDGSVMFLGQRDDVNVLYQAMDAFVLPSIYEGLPVVGIEAQAAGLPCFFSDEVTDEIMFSKDAQRLGLSLPAREWAGRIAKARSFRREDRTGLVRRKGFDIGGCADSLAEIYERMVRGGC